MEDITPQEAEQMDYEEKVEEAESRDRDLEEGWIPASER